MTERTISVDYLARVEGEGALRVRLRERQVDEVELKIFEPPRYFEAFLVGRSYAEAPDITARICGICPVAYQMSAVHAMEHALGIAPSPSVRELRRLLYCGEWIESHTLHIYLLHAPDFLGYPDAIRMARDHPKLVEQGLALKRVGNALMELLGGREVHPINVRVGGFYRAPTHDELLAFRPKLDTAEQLAQATVRAVAEWRFPEVDERYEFVALRHPSEYPMNEGELASSAGLRARPEEFEQVFEEVQVPYSNALHSVRQGGGSYLVGPMARLALNRDRLGPRTRQLANQIGLEGDLRNPFRSVIVRGLEVAYACEEAIRIIDAYQPPPAPFVPPPTPIPGGVGAAVTEAPRGILYHRYRLLPGGSIAEARIVAPTSQNQRRIEEDVRHAVERSVDLPDDALAHECERAIRNHDPCISCATHFLKLDLARS